MSPCRIVVEEQGDPRYGGIVRPADPPLTSRAPRGLGAHHLPTLIGVLRSCRYEGRSRGGSWRGRENVCAGSTAGRPDLLLVSLQLTERTSTRGDLLEGGTW